MPKIGQKPDNRPFMLRCTTCEHPVEKLVDYFNLYGKPARHVYYCSGRCDCGEPRRQGCIPERVYEGEKTP